MHNWQAGQAVLGISIGLGSLELALKNLPNVPHIFSAKIAQMAPDYIILYQTLLFCSFFRNSTHPVCLICD